MRIEPAQTDDVDDLVDAWVALAETQRSHGSHLAGEANRDAIRPVLAYHVVDGSAFVARPRPSGSDGIGRIAGDRILGFVTFGLEEAGLEADAVRGIVHNLFVDPDSRNVGVGSALLDAAEERLAERGAEVVAIEALTDNDDARRLYRQRGYRSHRIQYEWTTGSDTDTKEGG